MSFKREGDDLQQLGVLRQRRILDLFAEDIAEDEASLLSNGRFTCLVCNHRPIFDTVNMLAVHRRGKKHEANLKHFNRKKRELQALIQKRQHEKFLHDGTTNIDQAVPSYRGLGNIAPYNPCVKRKRLKPYDRKMQLDLSSTDQHRPYSVITDTSFNQLPGNRFPSTHNGQDISQFGLVVCDISRSDPVKVDLGRSSLNIINTSSQIHAKQICGKKNETKIIVSGKNKKALEDLIKLQSKGPVQHPNSLKKLVDRSRKSDVIIPYISNKARQLEDSQTGSKIGTAPKNCDQNLGNIYKPSKEVIKFELKQADLETRRYKSKSFIPKSSEKTADLQIGFKSFKKSSESQKCLSGKDPIQSNMAVTAKEDTSMTRAEKALMLRGAGWKRDWDGKWIKDEDAEFDSDEEPPDLP
ncbi:hypothetical protein CHS0354_020168 [Potamilus streckersoni]|uniref:Sodium channel modifier 1 n=1 Tax=Potamilus streckersoni TaxID=2493646 RepID=A0AAE0S570_9BIVA|nr:hypothetical protein CHS0354_020168 [Potamilus streckersoni]